SRSPAEAGVALLEHRDPDAVRAELPRQDVNVDLEALPRGLRRGVPVGDDDAAERVGRRQWHERHGVERGAPQIAVDADAAAALLVPVATAATAEELEAARAEHAFRLAVLRYAAPAVLVGVALFYLRALAADERDTEQQAEQGGREAAEHGLRHCVSDGRANRPRTGRPGRAPI